MFAPNLGTVSSIEAERVSVSIFRMLCHNRFSQRISIFALLLVALGMLVGCSSREERIASALRKADAAIDEEDFEEAAKLLEKAAIKYEDSSSVHESLANVYESLGDLGKAAETFKEVIELDSKKGHLWVRVGEIYTRLERNAEAIESFKSYLESHSNDFLAWKNITLLHEREGEISAAINAALKWNNLRPSSSPALKLGSLFQISDNIPQARSWYSQGAAYKGDPDARESLTRLIDLEIRLQQYLPAETWLKAYQQRYANEMPDGRIENAKTMLAKWKQAQEDIALAAKRLEQQRRDLERRREEAAQREEEARKQREAYLAEQKNLAEQQQGDGIEKAPTALSNDGSGLDVNSDSTSNSKVDTLLQTAKASYDAGDFQAAIGTFWLALGEDANDPEIWHMLANAYMENESWSDAEACLLEAKRRAPRSADIAADYLSTISHTQSASKWSSEAQALQRLFPQDARISLLLAQSLRKANASRSKILRAYNDFLQLASPDMDGYQEATSYLNRGI